MLTGQVALAAAQVDSLQTVEIIADDNVNIFDYSFLMSQPSSISRRFTTLPSGPV